MPSTRTCECCGQPLKLTIAEAKAMIEKRDQVRDPSVPCPVCGCRWLYVNVTDQCYECGRNVGTP